MRPSPVALLWGRRRAAPDGAIQGVTGEGGVRIPVQDFKSMRIAVTIWATEVNTHIHTDRQTVRQTDR